MSIQVKLPFLPHVINERCFRFFLLLPSDLRRMSLYFCFAFYPSSSSSSSALLLSLSDTDAASVCVGISTKLNLSIPFCLWTLRKRSEFDCWRLLNKNSKNGLLGFLFFLVSKIFYFCVPFDLLHFFFCSFHDTEEESLLIDLHQLLTASNSNWTRAMSGLVRCHCVHLSVHKFLTLIPKCSPLPPKINQQHGRTKQDYLAAQTEDNIARKRVLAEEWKSKFTLAVQMACSFSLFLTKSSSTTKTIVLIMCTLLQTEKREYFHRWGSCTHL